MKLLTDNPYVFANVSQHAAKAINWLIESESVEKADTGELLKAMVRFFEEIWNGDLNVYRKATTYVGGCAVMIQFLSGIIDKTLPDIERIDLNALYNHNYASERDGEVSPSPRASADKAFNRVSLMVALNGMYRFPSQIAVFRPRCWKRFMLKLVQFVKQEPDMQIELPQVGGKKHVHEVIAYIMNKGFYTVLSGDATPSAEDARYAHVMSLINELRAMEGHPVFTRSVALDLLIVMGALSQIRQTPNEAAKGIVKETKWRKEFEEMLDQYCVDEEPAIRFRALRVDTTAPVSFQG